MSDETKKPETGSVIVGDGFIGLKDADGDLLVDDTGYFRQQEIERPIWEALEASTRMKELRGMADVARQLLEADGGEALRTLCRTHNWIEQYIVSTCAMMIEEAKIGR